MEYAAGRERNDPATGRIVPIRLSADFSQPRNLSFVVPLVALRF